MLCCVKYIPLALSLLCAPMIYQMAEMRIDTDYYCSFYLILPMYYIMDCRDDVKSVNL